MSLNPEAAPDDEAPVVIHTDGSCLGNPGPGGWAARLAYRNRVKYISGGFASTTNNRMELYAALYALESLKRPCRVELYTDSRYLRDAVEKGWLQSWQRKNWKKAKGGDVLNRDLWERVALMRSRHDLRLHWLEGHAGHVENEEVDRLARFEARRDSLPPDTGYVPATAAADVDEDRLRQALLYPQET
ncbi:MAG: ribonuclease HI [Desulfovibrio sp.]|nr:ribonuclease HI [Desulfovibrio sp.]